MLTGSFYDAAVIGSGFGGAVVACRLAEAGMKVCVLERGRRWEREEFPRPGCSADLWRWDPPRSKGLFETRRFASLDVLAASGLGGGSLVYTNVCKRAPAESFSSGWPPEIKRQRLDPYYDKVEAMLDPSPAPKQLKKTEALREIARRLGREDRFESARLAIYWGQEGVQATNRFSALQTGCIYCGMCALGCHVHAKNTLDLNYLKVAESCGARIFTLCKATKLEPTSRGYRVRFLNLDGEQAREGAVEAQMVVVSAGTIGSNELLLRSKYEHRTLPNLSRMLGQRFSANGDLFAIAFDTDLNVSPTYGPTVTALLNFWDEGGFYLMEGGFPEFVAERFARPIAWITRAHSLLKLRREPSHPSHHMMALFLMGVDSSDGALYLDAKGRLNLRWHPSKSDSMGLFGKMRMALKDMARAMNAFVLVDPRWTLRRRLATVHPLGGCAMAASPDHGVVDAQGQAFGYKGLYVVDGSIVPRALGVPPSLTIAALAEQIAERIRSSNV